MGRSRPAGGDGKPLPVRRQALAGGRQILAAMDMGESHERKPVKIVPKNKGLAKAQRPAVMISSCCCHEKSDVWTRLKANSPNCVSTRFIVGEPNSDPCREALARLYCGLRNSRFHCRMR
jgi:hypothetical protein